MADCEQTPDRDARTPAVTASAACPELIPWTVTMLHHAPNGYLQISARAHPRDRDVLLPLLRCLYAGVAAR